MKTRPFVVFVFSREGTDTSTRYGGFAKRLQKAGMLPDHDVITVALENLLFCIDENNNAQVFDTVSGTQLDKAAFVYLKSWEPMPEEAAALTIFLHYRGVPFADNLPLGMGVSKLAVAFKLWANGIAMPPTLYVRRADRLRTALKAHKSMLGSRFIIKDVVGEKGKLNYLADEKEVKSILEANPDKRFICQRFVPNDGDYRIGIYMGEPKFVIKRTSGGQSHLNNTSAGGNAVYLDISQLSEEMLEMASAAAEAAHLQIAGIDIIIDKDTQRPYLLEVNQGSQIVTGVFIDKNMPAFAEAINRAVKQRYAKPLKRPLKLIGRQEAAEFPELGIRHITAKIDSGAYFSALHAENIREEKKGTARELVFDIMPGKYLKTPKNKPVTVRTKDFAKEEIRSSNGHISQRYVIRTKLKLAGKVMKTDVTLVDRSSMRFPLLVGRKALRSRFLIHVELAEDGKQD